MKATLVAIALMLISATNTFAAGELPLSPKQIKALGILTAPLPPKSTGELAGLPAQVVIPANQLFIVSTPLPALVEQILVGVGDQVTKGQVLARLQSPALAEAQRGYLQASTQEQLARGNFNRDEQLWQDGIIAESRYRAAHSQFIEAKAALAERKQMLQLSGASEASISKLQSGASLSSLLLITSPIDGVVLEKNISAGQRLDSATSLFNVAKLLPLGIEINAPLASVKDLKVGADVKISAFAASGKLTAIGQSLSDNNQTVLLRGLLHKGTQNLRPGQHVEVSIATRTSTIPQWKVPNAALARSGGNVQIFVATDNGFQAVVVKVINEGISDTLISGKLSGNENIAVYGVSVLKAQLMGQEGKE
jgi:membrane fusion protein, heavy metal efflux system